MQMAAYKKAIRLAADEECGNPDRIFCKPGLEKTYGFQITVDPLGFGSTTGKAVVQGKDDVALTGTTDGTLPQLGLVLLEDDKKLQAADNVLPVVNEASAGARRSRPRSTSCPPSSPPRTWPSSTCRWTASAREAGGGRAGLPDLQGPADPPLTQQDRDNGLRPGPLSVGETVAPVARVT